MKFNKFKLNDQILKNLSKIGFDKMTDIQFKSIPNIMRGNDLLAIAQTGGGKTAAFVIPILNRLISRDIRLKRGIKCLILVPTRELAIQIENFISSISNKLKIKHLAIYGGVEFESQKSILEKNVDILISTPGRFFDLNNQGYIKTMNLEYLVLDEADHMLKLGFLDDIRSVMKIIPHNRKTLFFSATINKEIKTLAYSLINQKAIKIEISPKNFISRNIKHSVFHTTQEDKRLFLKQIIKENYEEKIIIFVRTKVRAGRLKKQLAEMNIEASEIHGDITQIDRSSIIEQFKNNNIKRLITTDLTSRGIDIPKINLVINYDLPDIAENYVHRIGRTGRANNKGVAISFCTKSENELLNKIEDFIQKKIKVLYVDKDNYNTIKESTDNELNEIYEIIDEIELIENIEKSKDNPKLSKNKNKKKK